MMPTNNLNPASSPPDIPPQAKPNPWWTSYRFHYLFVIIVGGAGYCGIPWFRSLALHVPSQTESTVTEGTFKSGPVKGRHGFPIFVTPADGSTLTFSCSVPDPKSSSATCFRNQETHNGSQVKVFWSEQPAGFLSGTVKRPSRIEKLDGTVLFSEEEARRHLEANRATLQGPLGVIYVLGVLMYFPLMRLFDRMDAVEKRQRSPLVKEK
jgi:hypothetical protein